MSGMRLSAPLLPLLLVIIAPAGVRADAPTDAPPPQVEFNRAMRPIFSDTCLTCHAFDANKRKKNLRLDLAEGAYKALKDGSHPIVPGRPDQSTAYQRIITDDPDD